MKKFKDGKAIRKVQKVGYSLTITIPDYLVGQYNIKAGDEMLISEENGKIIIERNDE